MLARVHEMYGYRFSFRSTNCIVVVNETKPYDGKVSTKMAHLAHGSAAAGPLCASYHHNGAILFGSESGLPIVIPQLVVPCAHHVQMVHVLGVQLVCTHDHPDSQRRSQRTDKVSLKTSPTIIW